MPRVNTITKNTRGKVLTCAKCRKEIAPKQRYYQWAFRFGGTFNQHVDCGYPRRSQLTQSKLGALYDAQDGAQETIATADNTSDIAAAVMNVVDTAREIAEEYREAVTAMNMEGSGNQSEENADALESYADTLEGVADEIDGEEFEAEDKDEDAPDDAEELNADGENEDEWLQRMRDQAADGVSECDV